MNTSLVGEDLAYWERNMLALYFAEGWYNDDLDFTPVPGDGDPYRGPRYPGWRRVLSLAHGKITFHIPDEFDIGNLLEIRCNWDGHTTAEKWQRIADMRGIYADT